MKLIYEGKAKRLYETEEPNEVLMEFKDDATAFNGAKKASFAQKGRINKELSVLIYEMLEKEGIPTHYLRDHNETSIIARRVEVVKIELVIRNIVAGSLAKRTGLPEGQKYPAGHNCADERHAHVSANNQWTRISACISRISSKYEPGMLS